MTLMDAFKMLELSCIVGTHVRKVLVLAPPSVSRIAHTAQVGCLPTYLPTYPASSANQGRRRQRGGSQPAQRVRGGNGRPDGRANPCGRRSSTWTATVSLARSIVMTVGQDRERSVRPRQGGDGREGDRGAKVGITFLEILEGCFFPGYEVKVT